MTGTSAASSTEAGEPKSADGTTGATGAAGTPTDTSTGQPGTEDTKTEDAKAPEVPESYDLKMPDGIELDKAAADEFSAIAKELKLDNTTAQKLADVAAKMQQRQVENHTKLVESWVEKVKTDKDIGGDKLDENLAVARKALEAFGTPELRDVLNSTGFGNHPEIIKAFYKAGKAISEDGIVKGSPKTGETDPAKKMFPSMN